MTTVAEALSADRTAAALERIATALEQLVLEQVAKHDSQPGHDAFDHFHDKPQGDPYPADLPPVEIGDPAPQYAAVPVVIPPAPRRPAGNCPQHHTEWKFVPPGVSRRTGQSYAGFWACSTPGCDQRPPR